MQSYAIVYFLHIYTHLHNLRKIAQKFIKENTVHGLHLKSKKVGRINILHYN